MTNDKKRLSNIAFSKDAPDYDRSPKYSTLRESYPKIRNEALVKPFRTVLDIGCGTGALLRMIREKRKDALLFGIDLSEQMTQVALPRLGENADLRVSDSEKLPFASESFDLVTCTFSFHRYPNPGNVLLEMRRVLAPSGRLLLADPSPPMPLRQVMNFVHLFTNDGTVRIYPKKEMKALIETAGLQFIKWEKLNWHSCLFVAVKKSWVLDTETI